MRRSVIAAFCALLLASAVVAQQEKVAKGSKRDLRGAVTVVVDTGYDRELREYVVAHLARELPELAIVEEPSAGSLVLRFSRGVAPRSRVGDRRDAPFGNASSRANPKHQPVPRALSGGVSDVQSPRLPSLTRGQSRAPEINYDQEFGSLPPPTRYALGSVLKPTGDGSAVEAMRFKQGVRTSYDSAARDFVRKLAKAYRAENKK